MAMKRRVKAARAVEKQGVAASPAFGRDWTASTPACLLLIVLLCAVFVGMAHGYDGKDLDRGYDWMEQITFYKDFLVEAWQKGEFPLWCPYVFGGRPYAADPTMQCFYPTTVLWLVLPKLVAYVTDTLLHYVLGGLFAFLFLRALDVRPSFAALGGVLYTTSGFNVSHMGAGHLNFHAAVALLPLAFWCVEKAVGGRREFWLWGGAVLGVQFFAGGIPVSWMTFLFTGLYALVRSAWPWSPRRLVEGIAGYGVMALLGVGVSAVQLLPTAEFASLGVRTAHSYEYSIYQDLPPRNLANLFFPHGKIEGPDVPEDVKLLPEGEFNGYIGIVALGLGAAGLTLTRRRPATLALAAILALALLLALGDSTPLFRLFWWVLPGVSALREHAREILFLSFTMVCAGMIALEEFARAAGERARSRRGGIATAPVDSRALDVALWTGLGVLALGGGASFLYLAGNPTAPLWQTGFILLAVAALWLARRKAASPAFALGLVALCFTDVAVNAWHLDPWFTHARAPAPAMEESIARVLREDGGLFRGHFHKRAYRRERFSRDRFSGVDGYAAMIPRRWYELIHALSDAKIKDYLTNEATQDMFYTRSTAFPFRVLNVKYTTVQQQDRSYRLVENPDPDPRVWLAAGVVVLPDDEAATRLLKSPAFDPRGTAILDAEEVRRAPTSIAPSPPGGAGGEATPSVPAAIAASRSLSKDGRVSTTEAGRCEVVELNLNSQRVKVSASRPGLLVVSEGWFPGWTASVDGKDATLYRTHVTLRGVEVPAGDHEVVFRYRPRSIRTGLLVTLLSAALAVGGAVLIRQRARRGSAGAE